MLICLACYGDRLATLLESATELRFYALPLATDCAELSTRTAAHPAAKVHQAIPLHNTVRDSGLDALLELLEAEEAGVLLCGGLTCCTLETLRQSGVRVVPWIGGTASEVAEAWWTDTLHTMRMPGCAGCAKRRRQRGCRKQPKENADMQTGIIAVTSEGPQMDSTVDPRFGRAAGFVVVNLADMTTTYIDNGGSQAMTQGAGIQAAENVSKAGAHYLLSGFVGPKAFQALSAAGIKVIQDVEGMTVGQAVEKFRSGEFAVAEAPNAQSGGRKAGA